jgi:HK97 family phage major capsid protein
MIKEMIEKRANLAKQANDLLTRAKDGVLNSDEETQFNAMHAEIETITKSIELREKQAQIEKHLAEPQARKTEARTVQGLVQRAELDRELILRGWLLGGTADIPADSAEAAARARFDLRGKFMKFNLAKNPLQLRAQGDNQSVAENVDGGYTVPNETMRALEDALLHFGGMRQVASVIRTTTGANLPIPTSDDTSVEGDIVAENTTYDDHTGIAFGQIVLHAFKYTSKPVLASLELLQDSSINVGAFVGQKLGERIGRKQNSDFTIGGGTTLPFGIVVRSGAGVARAGSVGSGITYDDIVDLEHSVDVAYRANAKWMMHDVMVARLKKLRDDVGRPLWQAGLAVGAPNTINGYPYQVNNSMVSTATNGSKALLFGALDKYLIRDVREITLVRLDELFALYGQVCFVAWARSDGDLLDAGTDPVKHFVYTT